MKTRFFITELIKNIPTIVHVSVTRMELLFTGNDRAVALCVVVLVVEVPI